MESNTVSAAASSPPSNVPFAFDNSKNQKNRILKPIRQEKVLKVPVTKFVETIVEKEEIKYVNKYVDVIKPIITCRTKHVSKPVYLDKIKYEPKFIEREKIVHIPKIEYRNKIVEVPVYVHKHNIIEKKVPIVIERVIPVLKVKRVEKTVLTNSVEIPNSCESKQVEINNSEKENEILKIVNNENTHNNVSTSNIENVITSNENEETYNKETYRNVDCVVEPEIVITPPKASHLDLNETAEENLNNSNDINNESFLNFEHNETMYNEENREESHRANEEENFEEASGNDEVMVSNKSTPSNLNENKCDAENVSEERNINMPRINVHAAPAEDLLKNSFERQFVNLPCNSNSSYSMNMNYLVNDGNMTNGMNYNSKYESVSMSGLNSQHIHEFFNTFKKPTVQNIETSSLCSCNDEMKKSMAVDQRKQFNSSNINISNVNYTSSQRAFNNSQYITSASRIMPTFANANGQSFVSVRPATILEYTSKQKKGKTPICNFMNRCCGGSNMC